MKLVMKFGGSSLSDGTKLMNSARIVAESLRSGNMVVAVVSALADVTDELIMIGREAVTGKETKVGGFVQGLTERHRLAAERAIADNEIQNEVLRQLGELAKSLEGALLNVVRLRELAPRAQDYIMSFGEKFSAALFCGILRDLGLESRWLTGQEAGVFTNNHFGSAQPLMKLTSYEAKEVLGPLLNKGVVPVVTGFIGATPEGVTTTLGRGGSDYSATILAVALEADEVCIWSDVDGLMTADPRIEERAQTIALISYDEAIEMAYFGAKGMHPKALEPAAEVGIPVRIKNTFSPEASGTLIVKEQFVKGRDIVKAIAMIKDVSLVTVSGAGMAGTPGVAASVFSVLGQNGVNILMISQSSSEANISFIVPRHDFLTAVNALEMNLLGKGTAKEVTSEENVSIIAVVGAGMKGMPGVAARVFKAVSEQGVNIRMIAQGSSELNISFVVKAEDGIKALRTLHHEFGLDG